MAINKFNKLLHEFCDNIYYTNDKSYINLIEKYNLTQDINELVHIIKQMYDKNFIIDSKSEKIFNSLSNTNDSSKIIESIKQNLIASNGSPILNNKPNIIYNYDSELNKIHNFVVINNNITKNEAIDVINYNNETFNFLNLNKNNLPIFFNISKDNSFGKLEDNHISINKVNGLFKNTTFTHEFFHYIDSQVSKSNLLFSDEFDTCLSCLTYDEYFKNQLNELKSYLPNFANFIEKINSFQYGNLEKKLNFAQKYLNHYLDLNIYKDITEQELFQQLQSFNIKTNKEQASKIYDYLTKSDSESLYSITSEIYDTIEKQKLSENNYLSSSREKLARIFQMNIDKSDDEIYQTNPTKDILYTVPLPLGIEKQYYLTELNHIVKNELVPFFNKVVSVTQKKDKSMDKPYGPKFNILCKTRESNNLADSNLKFKY